MKIIFTTLFCICFTSCSNYSENQKFKSEILKLKSQIKELEAKYDSITEINVKLKQKLEQETLNTSKTKYYTEAQARKYLDDYYDFYNAEYEYRNLRIRRRENNVFDLSFEECLKSNISSSYDTDFLWKKANKQIIIFSDGKYVVQ